jgi:NAD(P)-dependent dehydrogenase (short-subunit alcohol dehydrogenase family)
VDAANPEPRPLALDPAALFDLSGRVALVLGAAGGLGAASAEALAAFGADVALADLAADRLGPVEARVTGPGRRALSLPVEVTDSASVDACVERTVSGLGRLDILVYSVGINVRRPIVEQTDEDWERILRVNLTGAFYACRAFGRVRLRSGGGGRAILITSLSSLLALPGLGPYSASKGGMKQLLRVLALEWAEHGITVNGLAPTYVETGLTRAHLAQPGMRERMTARVPMGRLCTAADLVGALIYLASPSAAFVTGQTIYISGGAELD